MAMMISTGTAKGLLDSGSLKALLAGMVLRIYGGTVPASANDSVGSATLLCVVTANGSGDPLSFEAAAVGNVIEKSSSETWEGENVATGVATFCRLELDSDDGTASSTAVRIQGDVGTAGRFLNLSSTSLTVGATQAVDSLAIAMPLQ